MEYTPIDIKQSFTIHYKYNRKKILSITRFMRNQYKINCSTKFCNSIFWFYTKTDLVYSHLSYILLIHPWLNFASRL